MFRKSGRIILDENERRGTGIIFYSDGCRKWNELLRHPFTFGGRKTATYYIAFRVAHFYGERRFEKPHSARFTCDYKLSQYCGTGEWEHDFYFFCNEWGAVARGLR